MSQLLQVRTITQVIDSRIAQFSTGTRDLPVTTPTRMLHPGSKAPAKLKPLDHTPGLRGKTEDQRAARSQLSPLPKPRAALRATTMAVRKSENKPEPPQPDRALNSTSVSTLQVDETKEERALERWTALLESVLEQGQTPVSHSVAYHSLRRCLFRLKSAVKFLERKQVQYQRKVRAVVRIQAWVRGTKLRRSFVTQRYAVYQIQRYWRQVGLPKAALQRVKRAARLVTAWWRYRLFRLQFAQRRAQIVRIQKTFRGFRTRKTYLPLLKAKAAESKHARFMQQQAKKVEDRNRRIAAVKTIERYWAARQQRRNLAKIRKYLWTLPYECRLLYLKFKQVKADADMLKRDVETLIATKKNQAAPET